MVGVRSFTSKDVKTPLGLPLAPGARALIKTLSPDVPVGLVKKNYLN